MILTKKPIILVPGFGGSKLIRKTTQHPSRPVKNDFINLNIFRKEWLDDFKLKYDSHQGFTLDDDIDIHDFGGLDGIRNLCEDCDKIDNLLQYLGQNVLINDIYNYKYFDTLIERLEKDGYVPCIDLFGAPYDFRKIVFESYLTDYAVKLTTLIEKAYHISKKPCVLIAHSIGSVIIYILLCEYLDYSWKSKYIDCFVSIAGPYGGCSTSLKTLISGLPKLNFLKEKYADIMSRCSGLALALPNEYGYHKHTTLIKDMKHNKSYSVENFHELLPESMNVLNQSYVKPLLPLLKKNTGVRTIFICTTQTKTEQAYIYDSIETNTFKEPIDIHLCKGDSVIPLPSLHLHKKYLHYFNYHFYNLENTEHTKILHTKGFYKIIKSLTL